MNRSYTGNARIILLRPLGAIGLGVNPHAAEFGQRKFPALIADTVLPVEDSAALAAIFEPDDQHRQEHDGRGDDDENGAGNEIERAGP